MAGRDLKYEQVTMASGQAISSAFVIPEGQTPLGCYLPANFSGTAVTLQSGKNANDTFAVVNGFSKTVTASTKTYVPFEPYLMAGVGAIKVVSGTNQVATGTIEIVYGQVRG